MTEFRTDVSTIKSWEIDSNGFLRWVAPIAKVGKMKYINADGSVRHENVSADVLKQSADSFKMLPTTLRHPPEPVTPVNSRKYQTGSTGHGVYFDNSLLWITGVVTDQANIDAIKSGQCKQISCGYGVKVQKRSDGEYEQVQRVGNHVSFVERARAGEDVALHLDSADAFWWSQDVISSDGEIPSVYRADSTEETPSVNKLSTERRTKKRMHTVNLDGISVDIESLEIAKHLNGINSELQKLRADSTKASGQLEAANAAIADLKAKLEASESQTRQLQSNLDAAESRYDSLKLDYDDIRNRADSDDSAGSTESVNNDELAAIITERMQLWNEVLPFLRSDSPDYEPDYTLEPIAIMTEAVRAANPELQDHLDSLDLSEPEAAGFVKGLFATLNSKQFAQRKNPRRNVDSLLEDIRSQRSDGGMYTDPMMAKTEAKKKRQARIRGNASAMMGQ